MHRNCGIFSGCVWFLEQTGSKANIRFVVSLQTKLGLTDGGRASKVRGSSNDGDQVHCQQRNDEILC